MFSLLWLLSDACTWKLKQQSIEKTKRNGTKPIRNLITVDSQAQLIFLGNVCAIILCFLLSSCNLYSFLNYQRFKKKLSFKNQYSRFFSFSVNFVDKFLSAYQWCMFDHACVLSMYNARNIDLSTLLVSTASNFHCVRGTPLYYKTYTIWWELYLRAACIYSWHGLCRSLTHSLI